MDEEKIPYWKDYHANVTRGLIAAALCSLFFIFWFIGERILEKRHRSRSVNIGTIGTSYNKETDEVNMKGVDNYGMNKQE